MNISERNSSVEKCFLILLQPSLTDKILNTLKMTIFIMNFLWCILVVVIKDFRTRQMIFLHNLNLICFANNLVSMSGFFYTNCTLLSDLSCFLQAYANILTSLLSGYGISALAIYRLFLIKVL